MAKRKRKDAEENASEDSSCQDLYQMLGVERTASQEEIKKAYHKLALRLHPDKNPGDNDANQKFQSLQKVFSILGDPENRSAYDETGCVENVELLGKEGKTLYKFFRTLYKTVTEEEINAFATTYRGSEQEKTDLKKYYTETKGNINKIFQMVMCSDPNLDSHRFMEVIDAAIAQGELKESKSYRKWAKDVAKRPPPANPLTAPKQKESFDLMSAIQNRGKQKMDLLTSKLAARYCKKKQTEEPSEDDFQAARVKLATRKETKSKR